MKKDELAVIQAQSQAWANMRSRMSDLIRIADTNVRMPKDYALIKACVNLILGELLKKDAELENLSK